MLAKAPVPLVLVAVALGLIAFLATGAILVSRDTGRLRDEAVAGRVYAACVAEAAKLGTLAACAPFADRLDTSPGPNLAPGHPWRWALLPAVAVWGAVLLVGALRESTRRHPITEPTAS